MAYVALFVALGGTSYAAVSISGENVQDGTLTGADIQSESIPASALDESARKAIRAAATRGPRGPRGKRGYRGWDGATGPAGPAGPQGIQGIPGTSGITGWEYARAQSSVSSNISRSVTVTCPTGKRPISASADIDGVNPDGTDAPVTIPVFLTASYGGSIAGVPAWTVEAYEDTGGYEEPWRIEVSALCVNLN